LASLAAYEGYVEWKGWDRLFSPKAEQAAYFAGEMRGIAIAGADVLEIGFGAGAFLAWARSEGAQVSGVEIIPALIEKARQEGVPILPSDLETVSELYREAFDTIVAFDVFEHFTVEMVARRLVTCTTMLKPGGHLLLRFPNGQSPFGLAPQGGDITHRSALSRSVIEQLTRGGDLIVVRYAPQFRIKGGGVFKDIVRRLRHVARDCISAMLNAIYSEDIPWDAVVVIVLTKGSRA
jgi:SAM-dependent methyltransferase